MKVLKGLEPAKVFEYFEWISSVPRGSGHTKAVSDLMVSFAREHGLSYVQDEMNNVIIRKPASAGMENAPVVILQAHLDMVLAKTDTCSKDLYKEPIELQVEGNLISAKETTLGGDDGIAVAMILAVLDDETLVHPALEALLTTDEETGMYGAAALDASVLKGRMLINIDSEEEGIFTAGCAGGMRLDSRIPVRREALPANAKCYEVVLDGVLGGHSGMSIALGRAFTHRLMARFLDRARGKTGLRLIGLQGGRFDNVICGKTTAVAALPSESAAEFEALAKQYHEIFREEYRYTDPDIRLQLRQLSEAESAECFGGKEPSAVCAEDTASVLYAILVLPQGVERMSPHFRDLPQTSLNMGIVDLKEDALHLTYSIRSSVSSEKYMLMERVQAVIGRLGGTSEMRSEYPAWPYDPDSPLLKLAAGVFEQQYGRKPEITATHGGLECGLFSEKIEGLDCISIGPNLYDVHSPRERMEIDSAARTYSLLTGILQQIR